MNRRDIFRLAAASLVAPLAPVLPKTVVLPFAYGKAERMEPVRIGSSAELRRVIEQRKRAVELYWQRYMLERSDHHMPEHFNFRCQL